MSRDLVSTSDFAKFLGGDLDTFLDAAVDAARRYCGWHVAPIQEQTVQFQSVGREFSLPTLRVAQLLEIRIGGEVAEPTSYRWTTSGWVTLSTDPGDRPVQVRMLHGFDPKVEASNFGALAMGAAARAKASPAGYIRQQAGTMSYAPTQMANNAAGGVGFLDWEKRELDQYRLVDPQ